MMRGNMNNVLGWCLGAGIWAAAMATAGCVTGNTVEPGSEAPVSVSVEKITVVPSGEGKTVVEIDAGVSTPYSAFKLLDPPRIIVDVLGVPGAALPAGIEVGEGPIDRITVESIGTQAPTTRITVHLSAEVDYGVVEKADRIVLSVFPQNIAPDSPAVPEFTAAGRVEERAPPAEPRIFFPAGVEPFNRVRGVDFTMLEGGKSRLIVTTSDKADYTLRRVGDRGVMLSLEKSTIPELLQREIDSRYFEGVIEKAGARFVPETSRVEILLTLKEMVPYHVVQDETEIRVDFFKTSVQPPRARLDAAPRALPETRGPEPARPVAPPHAAGPGIAGEGGARISAAPGIQKEYTGTPMTMEFVNADVTNILRLIGEVSNLNIIWGPEVTGTVSMRLRKVPWDQALDLVLANNDLDKEIRGNVIWVTTRSKMESLKAAERQAVEEERKRKLAEREESRELEELRTEYFPVDFAKAGEIKKHLDEIKTKDRGTVSVDERTNTVILQDTAAKLAEAKNIVDRFDTPVKQIMIEARIVDATTSFSRDLGVQWTNVQRKWKKHESQDWGGDPEAYSRFGDMLVGGGFVTDAPQGWTGNIGLSIARLTNRGLGTLALDATLALAETENKATIISAPRVIASNGEEAVISRGDEILREIVTADQIKTETFEATLSLTVTPTVSFNDFVTMKLKVTDDKPYDDGSGKTVKEIDTTLMVKSGETIVIGGIYTEDSQESETGIPLLRDLPVLGWLFKARTKSKGKTELLIFVTPKVIEAARPDRKALYRPSGNAGWKISK